MAVRISSKSTVYIKQRVKVSEAGSEVDPTGNTVEVQFVEPGVDPADGDWITGTWETDATVTPTRYYARGLVGPSGDIELADGAWRMWVKVTDTPEIPVLPGDIIVVT